MAEMVRYEYIMKPVREWERRTNERLAQEKAARTVNSDMELVVMKRWRGADSEDGGEEAIRVKRSKSNGYVDGMVENMATRKIKRSTRRMVTKKRE